MTRTRQSARPRPASLVPLPLLARVFAITCALHGARAWALDPIDTDGPDFVESSEVVGKDHLQFELDLLRDRDRRGVPNKTTTAGSLLVRYGVMNNVEGRIETDPRVRVSTGATSSSAQSDLAGVGDTAIGVKWHSQDRDPVRGRPSVSWIAHAELPTGSGPGRGIGVRPSLRSVMTWDFPYSLAFGLMPGVKLDVAPDGRRFFTGILGAVLNKRVTNDWRFFVEASSPQIAPARYGGTRLSLDVGSAYLLGDDWQLGIRMAHGVTHNTANIGLLVEIAGRF